MEAARVRPGLREAFESAADRLAGMTLEQFIEAVVDFDVHAVRARGQLAGAILVRGAEIHACVLPWAHGRWFGRREIQILNTVIAEHGVAITRATTARGKQFVLALGFAEGDGIYTRSKPWELNRYWARSQAR